MSEFGKDLGDYFCKFTFGQFVSLILLELVTLFFVFYLGARYGPELIGGRSETTASTQETKEEAKREVNFSYPKELTGPGGVKPHHGAGPHHGVEPHHGAIKVKPSGMTATEYEKEGEEEAREPVVVPVPEEVPDLRPADPQPVVVETPEVLPKPAVQTPVKEGTEYTIQVGSFKTAKEASQAVTQWKGRGYSSFMTIGEIPNKGTWYRVRIGNFASKEEAKVFLEKFKSREKTDALVISTKS